MDFAGLHWIRRRQRALAKGALALFCLMWLQAALLPCAMALAPMGGGEMEHCVYCPEGMSGAVDTASDAPASEPGCLYPDAPQADQRAPIAAPAAAPLLDASFVLAASMDRPPDLRGLETASAIPRPPVAVSYCRFLK